MCFFFVYIFIAHSPVAIGNAERKLTMVTSQYENILRVTGPFSGWSTCRRWIPLTKASDAELWYFLWCAPEQMFGQTVEMLAIWDAIAPTVT